MKRFIEGADRHQVTLLPKCLDESPRDSRRPIGLSQATTAVALLEYVEGGLTMSKK